MPPAKSSSQSSSSLLYAMVVFVVLFLVATVAAVVLYLNVEKYQNEAISARTALREIGTPSEVNAVKALVQRQAGGGVTRTALGVISDNMKYMVNQIAGSDVSGFSIVSARKIVDSQVGPVWAELKNTMSNPQDADPSLGLARIVNKLIKQRVQSASLYLDAIQSRQRLAKQYQAQIKALQDEIAGMKKDLNQASSSASITEKTYSNLEKKLRSEYEKVIRNLTDEKNKLQAKYTMLEKDFANQVKISHQNEQKVINLQKLLQVARPGPGMDVSNMSCDDLKKLMKTLQETFSSPEMETAALEPDGKIVQVVPDAKLAYINLGRNDHIYRGLTFGVYDSFQPIPKSGKSKGAVEVIEILNNIAKCRIIDQDPTNPIMKNDIIANLIWSKDKKYLFCVAGDFDFNGDGKVDADGRMQIVSLIKAWGGKVTDKLTVNVDFLVLGQPPALPARPAQEYINTQMKEAVAYRNAVARLNNYKKIRQDAAALGVPTFNRDRFLRFIGYYSQAGKK